MYLSIIPIVTTTAKNNIPKPNEVSLKKRVKRMGVKIPNVGIPIMFLAIDKTSAPMGIKSIVVNIV
jgi:energy-converting hydrogenase Eha subunit E